MSVQVITWAYQQKCSAPLAKFLLITLANYANDQLEAWPSKSRLAEDMGCSESSVCKHLQTLESDGLVAVEARFVDNVQLTSKIRILASPNCGVVVRHAEGGGPSGGEGVVRHADTEPSLRTTNEPSGAQARGTTGREFWSKVMTPPNAYDGGVRFDGGKITLVNGTRTEWLAKFGNDAESLDLALLEIVERIQPNSNRPISAQVNAGLARIVRERRDRDRRYADAASRNSKSAASEKPFRPDPATPKNLKPRLTEAANA